MKAKYRNLFLLFGIVAIAVMLLTFDMPYDELWSNIRRAGYWFPAIIVLWGFIYMINAWAWSQIINDGCAGTKVPYWRVYKFTITGFALNYTTPVGLMGGEPYRIMELTPYVGVQKATSSVILYVMTHIFSHFCFWLFSVVLFVALYFSRLNMVSSIVLAIIAAACVLAIYFFSRGYRNGLARKGIRLLTHIPFLRRRANRLLDEQGENLDKIDSQIAQLHSQRPATFYGAIFLEFMGRVVNALEIYFILMILTSSVSFLDCVLILAFSSLFANILFFFPMQLGAREGGLAIIVDSLNMKGAYGVYTGLITRVRELIWIVIGIALMKFGNTNVDKRNNI
ncbi:MAG: flippase-like domain-containing protein [Bacteroidaceae bacterium]|nr:flippase-like domain-containing protein [Bacteroidaceae bacterium]